MARGADRERPASLQIELGSEASFLERVAAIPGSPPASAIAAIAESHPDLEVGELIGSGGMGVVFRARDTKLDRQVALKLQHVSGRPEAERQLMEEGRAMARLAHPNIVTVYDVREVSGHVVLLMEYVPGSTLAEWLAAADRTRDAILDVFLAAGDGLAAAHQAELVHRDFKPANVIVGADGRVRVADFGLALRGDAPPGVAGTPGYMAPEQRSGGAVDARADQYTFCVSLREALDGVSPGRRLRLALERGTAEDPDERWPDMAALLGELRSIRSGRRRKLTFAIAALACAGAALVSARSMACSAEPDCDDAAEAWAGAIERAAGTEVERALIASDRPFARTYAERIADATEDYGKRWIAARTARCEAADDRRVLCLDRRLIRVGAALDRLATASPEIADRSLDLIAASTGDLCDGDVALPDRVVDPALVAELEAIRALRLTGDPTAARERGAAIEAPILESGDPTLVAELDANRELAGGAVSGASLRDLDPLTVAELAVARGGELDATIAELERTDAPRFVLEAALIRRSATAADPVPYLSRALASRRSRLGDENPLLLPLLDALGARLAAADKAERAEPHLAAAVELGERAPSGDDTRVARLLALARAETELRHTRRAADRFRSVLELVAPGDPRHLVATLGLGRALMNDGQLEAGRAICREARGAFEARGDRGIDYAHALDCIGRAAIKVGDAAAALEAFSAAADVVEQLGGDEHLAVELRLSSASALLVLHRDREAVAVVDRSIARADSDQRSWAARMLQRSGITPSFEVAAPRP